MNPLDEAAKESGAHNGPVPSARDDYAIASPLQVVVDTQEGMLPLLHSFITSFLLSTPLLFCMQ